MKNKYNRPLTGEIPITAQATLLSSGKAVSNNLGLGWNPVPGDPNLAW